MKIRFLVPFLEPAGGIRAVFEIADRLQERGHDTAILVPDRSVLSRRNDWLRRLPLSPLGLWSRNATTQAWFPLQSRVVVIPDIRPGFLPEAEATVVTSWQTAERAAGMPPRCGTPFYFIQHYEIWSGPADRVDATWRLPYRRIASSDWIRRLGRERFGIGEMDLVVYGVNRAMFHPDAGGRPAGTPLRVGMLYHTEAWKGIADGLEAVQAARESAPPFELVLFGTCPSGRDVPPGTEYHLSPRGEDLRRLYASFDIFLCPSHEETGPMTVPEAMACGAAVVATDVGNVRVWTGDGSRALVSPPRDPRTLGSNLARLLSDGALRERLAREGEESIRAFTWERTAIDFERALLRGTGREL